MHVISAGFPTSACAYVLGCQDILSIICEFVSKRELSKTCKAMQETLKDVSSVHYAYIGPFMNPLTQKHELPEEMTIALDRAWNKFFIDMNILDATFTFPEDLPQDRLTGLCLRLNENVRSDAHGGLINIIRFNNFTNLTTLVLIDVDVVLKQFIYDQTEVPIIHTLPSLTDLTLADVRADTVKNILTSLACPEKLRWLRIIHRHIIGAYSDYASWEASICEEYLRLVASGIFTSLESLEIQRSPLSDWQVLAGARLKRLRKFVLREVPVIKIDFLADLQDRLEHVELVRTNLAAGWTTLETLANAKRLNYLSVAGNRRLGELGDLVETLENLEVVDISETNILYVADLGDKNKRLKRLIARGCALEDPGLLEGGHLFTLVLD